MTYPSFMPTPAITKIYLLKKNIKTQRPSNKLDFKKIEPFKIEE